MRKINFFLIIFVSLLTVQFAFIPQTHSQNSEITDLNSSQLPIGPIRIAIYDEPNVTHPTYSLVGTLTNNYTLVNEILTSAGYDISLLNVHDIYDHQLTTANYDVFIMIDNLPRDNITNYVRDFWLGGGSLLTFDSAVTYLCYFGILPPESAGDDGFGTYYGYSVSETQNISVRHPISKSYQVSDQFTIENADWATFDWAALQGTSIASELVRIATINGNANSVTVLGLDPKNRGGKVLHFLTARDFTGNQLLIDGIEWLCPKPKGRILYDLSHYPYYGIDSWDLPYSNYAPRYELLRDNLVNRSYMIDKLYPSVTGNLTSSNLAPYDILFIALSNVNYTAAEITAVTNWVNKGGSLLVLGENIGLNDYNMRTNDLLVSFDLKMNTTSSGSGSATYQVTHPTLEGCSQITVLGPGKIVHEGDAFPIWGADQDNIFVAGQEYGAGRVVLMSDVAPFRDSIIMSDDNLQYAVNLMNWLTANEANVLLFVDEPDSPNYYQTPVSNALNELGIDFYLTFDADYTNLSLNLYDWKLLIIDNPWVPGFSTSLLTEVNDFVKGGGRLIMSTFRVNNDPTHPLWARLGFAYDQAQPGGSSLYIWDPTHAIYNIPINYGASRFDPIRDYGDEGDLLTVFPNATALGGYTVSESADNANIVLANGGKTIFNGYLIDQFTGDLDDSTYADNFELWVNEISFMWAQIKAEGSGGIPGYDFYIVIGSVFVCLGLISLVLLKKRKNLIIK